MPPLHVGFQHADCACVVGVIEFRPKTVSCPGLSSDKVPFGLWCGFYRPPNGVFICAPATCGTPQFCRQLPLSPNVGEGKIPIGPIEFRTKARHDVSPPPNLFKVRCGCTFERQENGIFIGAPTIDCTFDLVGEGVATVAEKSESSF